jgi:hypothetical protein
MNLNNLAEQRSLMLSKLIAMSYSSESMHIVTGHLGKLGDSMSETAKGDKMSIALEREAEEVILPLMESLPEEEVVRRIEELNKELDKKLAEKMASNNTR